ncbi:MAG TPA: amidohydrolase/deacetylase family metallohydrolase [Methylomirabilota bacterium]|jgi:dihydroorotase|nr:amidohydrolase/deacetylase family metallohydrolase [Methylomirabilota bacterium]
MAPTWDLLIRGGTLIDPARSISAKQDVAFSRGTVAAVAERLAGEAAEVIDATGALVTPGLIDIHTHVYHGLSTGRHADQTSLANGVTTVVDAGSAGWMTLPGLRDYVIPTYRTRVYAFLHISATGLTINRIMPELGDINFAQVEEAARAASENRALILGIKVRIAHGATGPGNQANAREALRRGRQAADLAGVRLMVHVSDTPIPLDEILEELRAGDIATHIFNGNAEQVLGSDGRVRGAVRAAKERGVVLDVGHASVHCDVKVARRALDEGLLPTTLSTDLHTPPPGRIVYNLRGVMSKFLALGMTLDDVVASVTSRAAAAIGKSAELGSLAPGMAGDAVVLDLEDGHFAYVDSAGNEVKATRRFRTRHVVRAGRRLPAAHADQL